MVASLGILIFQGTQGDNVPLHALQPAQIQSDHVLDHATDPGAGHAQSGLAPHADGPSAAL
jgi:hypothetical protein